MKEQISLLENSFRTNLIMAKAMATLRLKELSKRYLTKAYKDQRLLLSYKAKYDQDETKVYKTI